MVQKRPRDHSMTVTGVHVRSKIEYLAISMERGSSRMRASVLAPHGEVSPAGPDHVPCTGKRLARQHVARCLRELEVCDRKYPVIRRFED